MERDGGVRLIRRLAKRVNHYLFSTTISIWFRRNLNEPLIPASPGVEVDIDFLDEDKGKLVEWLRINHQYFPWMYMEKEIASARSNGHIFTVIRNNGRIIGYLKVGLNNVYIHDFNRSVSFRPNKAFIYDTFILPEYRRKSLAHYAVIKTIELLKEKGVEELWCHIEKWNSASLNTFRKAGFRKKGDLRFIRLLGMPFFIRDGFRPLTSIEEYVGL